MGREETQVSRGFGPLGGLLRKRRLRLSREEALDARPLRNATVKSSVSEEGELLLQMERRKDLFGKLMGFLVAAPLQKRVGLDEMGRFVWDLCDGKHSVREIASLLGRQYRLNRREAVLSLTTFLRTLGRRGLIGFAVRKEENDAGAKN